MLLNSLNTFRIYVSHNFSVLVSHTQVVVTYLTYIGLVFQRSWVRFPPWPGIFFKLARCSLRTDCSFPPAEERDAVCEQTMPGVDTQSNITNIMFLIFIPLRNSKLKNYSVPLIVLKKYPNMLSTMQTLA